MVKIVVIGAGSASFGRGMVADTLQAEALRERDLTLCLVDLDATALKKMHTFAQLVKAHAGSTADIIATTDRSEVLPGANYVLTAVSIHRYPL